MKKLSVFVLVWFIIMSCEMGATIAADEISNLQIQVHIFKDSERWNTLFELFKSNDSDGFWNFLRDQQIGDTYGWTILEGLYTPEQATKIVDDPRIKVTQNGGFWFIPKNDGYYIFMVYEPKN